MRKFLSNLTWLGPTARRVIVIAVIVLAVLSVLGLAFNRQIRSGYRQWQSAKYLEEARAYAEAGEWESARSAAIAANDARRSVEALRLAFTAEQKTGGMGGVEMLSLFRHREATAEDRAAVLRMLIDLGDPLLADVLVRGLPDADRIDRGVQEQLVRLHVRAGRYSDALALVNVMAGGEVDHKLELLLAQEFAREEDGALKEAAVRHVTRALEAEDDEVALDAMRLIAALSTEWVPEALAEKAVRRVGNNPALEVQDRLRLTEFQIRLGHGPRKQLVQAAVSAYRNSHREELVTWLLGLGEYRTIVELTDEAPSPASLSRNVFTLRIAALDALGRYEQMMKELEDVAVPLDPPILLAYRAVAAMRVGNHPRASSFWKNAFERAAIELSQNYYFTLAELAEKAGMPDRKFEALARGIEHPFGMPPPSRKLEGLFEWLYAQGSTERLLAISYRLLRREPDNPALLNNYHFLRALHEDPAPEAVSELEALLRQDPTQVGFYHTLGFIHLRRGNPEKTLATFDDLGIRPKELSNESRAVYAAALAKLDRHDEAEAVADGIDWSKMSVAEVRILRDKVEPVGSEEEGLEVDRESSDGQGADSGTP